jgi:hypothetical protein
MSLNSVLKKRLSLISLGLGLAITLMSTSFPAPAHAQDGITRLKATLPVQWIATQICAQDDASCSTCVNQNGYYVEAQGLADTTIGPLFVQLSKCWIPYDGQFGTYSGILTTTAPNGKDSLTWVYSGKNDAAPDFYGFQPFSGTLTITAGTGKFAGARGIASFTAAGPPSFTAGPSPIQFAGTAFYYIQGRVELTSSN